MSNPVSTHTHTDRQTPATT